MKRVLVAGLLTVAAAFAQLDRGQIVAHGRPEEVLLPELLSRVYGVTMERVDRDGRPVVFPKVES